MVVLKVGFAAVAGNETTNVLVELVKAFILFCTRVLLSACYYCSVKNSLSTPLLDWSWPRPKNNQIIYTNVIIIY
jgi:hypothetical protein